MSGLDQKGTKHPNGIDVPVGKLFIDEVAVTATAAEINRACDVSARVVAVTGNVTLSAASHDGKVVTLDKAGGIAVTLPAASGSGVKFDLVVITTITSSATTVKVANASDVMTGAAIICNDSDATVSGFETASTTDTISLNGSTTGGIKGDRIELIDIAANLWYVRVLGSATGSEATPFSATVS